MSKKSTNKDNKRRSGKAQDNFTGDDGSQPALKKVGAGYDDTGSGNDAEASRRDERSKSKRSRANKNG